MKKKVLLIILFVLIFLLLSISVMYILFSKDASDVQDNNIYVTDLKKQKLILRTVSSGTSINNLIFSDTTFEKTGDGNNELGFVITNPTTKDIQLPEFNIFLKDEQNNVIETIKCKGINVSGKISFSYSALVSSDIKDIYCIEYVIV